MKKSKKDQYVRFRIDEKEKELLNKITENCNINRSHFFRQVIAEFAYKYNMSSK